MSSTQSIETFEVIGRGATTVVYRGHDMLLSRDVAVKELSAQACSDSRVLDQFVKEAQFLAQHQDENILTVYSVDRQRGWIVMELMNGSLADRLQRGPLDPDTVRSVLQQVLRALNFLHKKQKVHGNVRPTNMLINDEGRVKLSDFQETGEKSELRLPVGSKKYLAPELLKSSFGSFGPAMDLYCLGFSALELLKGQNFELLFPGTGAGAIDADTAWMRWHTSDEELRSVRELVPGLPDDLTALLDKMLKKHVADRPQSAQKALELLRDVPLKKFVVEPGTRSNYNLPNTKSGEKMAAAAAPADKASKSAAAVVKSDSAKGKSGFNEVLNRPYVLYPLCALMLIGAVFIGLALRGNKNKPATDLVAVQVNVEPADAAMTIDGKPAADLKPNEDGKFLLPPGKHKFAFNKAGYDPQEVEAEVNAEKLRIGPIKLTETKKVVPDPPSIDPKGDPNIVNVDPPPKQTPDPKLPVDPTPPDTLPDTQPLPANPFPRLPPGLIATKESKIDEELQLPEEVEVAALEGKAPLKLVLFRPGMLRYGVEGSRLPGELPLKQESLQEPFYLALTETTNEQFEEFSKTRGEEFEPRWRKQWEQDKSENFPARNVSWTASKEFCNWAGGDLPSEKEWEYAARASEDEGFPYPWQSKTINKDYANLFYGTTGTPLAVTDLPQGKSPRGLFHLLGNVAEWCDGDYELGHGDGNMQDHPFFKGKHPIRGCSYTKSHDDARITWRSAEADAGAPDIGFRLAVHVLPPMPPAAEKGNAEKENPEKPAATEK